MRISNVNDLSVDPTLIGPTGGLLRVIGKIDD